MESRLCMFLTNVASLVVTCLCRFCRDRGNPSDQSSWRRRRTCQDIDPCPWWSQSYQYQPGRQVPRPVPCPELAPTWCNICVKISTPCSPRYKPEPRRFASIKKVNLRALKDNKAQLTQGLRVTAVRVWRPLWQKSKFSWKPTLEPNITSIGNSANRLPSYSHFCISKMAVSRHLGFYRTANSAIWSADPENHSLEQTWSGSDAPFARYSPLNYTHTVTKVGRQHFFGGANVQPSY